MNSKNIKNKKEIIAKKMTTKKGDWWNKIKTEGKDSLSGTGLGLKDIENERRQHEKQ
jgi:hypothetical protein